MQVLEYKGVELREDEFNQLQDFARAVSGRIAGLVSFIESEAPKIDSTFTNIFESVSSGLHDSASDLKLITDDNGVVTGEAAR